jgi:hypothetical protein
VLTILWLLVVVEVEGTPKLVELLVVVAGLAVIEQVLH